MIGYRSIIVIEHVFVLVGITPHGVATHARQMKTRLYIGMIEVLEKVRAGILVITISVYSSALKNAIFTVWLTVNTSKPLYPVAMDQRNRVTPRPNIKSMMLHIVTMGMFFYVHISKDVEFILSLVSLCLFGFFSIDGTSSSPYVSGQLLLECVADFLELQNVRF